MQMLKRVPLFVLLMMLIMEGLWAQRTVSVARRYQQGTSQEEGMAFWYYPYLSSTLDLKEFKTRYPNLKNYIPDQVKIVPPDLAGELDVVYGVTYLMGNEDVHGLLVIMLISNFYSESPVHYIDYNQDGKYHNDKGSPYVFPEGVAKKELSFLSSGKSLVTFSMEIINPKFQEDLVISDENTTPSTDEGSAVPGAMPIEGDGEADFPEIVKPPLKDKLRVGLFVTMGFGRTDYSYNKSDTGYPTKYSAPFNSKGIGLDASYALGPIVLSANMAIEDLFNWSSTRETKLGEPYTVTETDWRGRIRTRTFSNINKEINSDEKPRGRFSVGLKAMYSIGISDRTAILPYIGAGFYQLNGEYVPNKSEPENSYSFENQWMAEIGVALRSRVGRRGAFNIQVGYRGLEFNPTGYFDRPEISDVKVNNYQIGINLGYEFIIF